MSFVDINTKNVIINSGCSISEMALSDDKNLATRELPFRIKCEFPILPSKTCDGLVHTHYKIADHNRLMYFRKENGFYVAQKNMDTDKTIKGLSCYIPYYENSSTLMPINDAFKETPWYKESGFNEKFGW